MSYLGKKFSWKNVSDFLTDKELKNVMGGSSGDEEEERCSGPFGGLCLGGSGGARCFKDSDCDYGQDIGPCRCIGEW